MALIRYDILWSTNLDLGKYEIKIMEKLHVDNGHVGIF